VIRPDPPGALVRGQSSAVSPDTISGARESLQLDSSGRPRCPDSREVIQALSVIAATGSDAFDEIVSHGFLAGAGERYAVHVEPRMRVIGGGQFSMGSEAGGSPYFQGETPRHQVVLPSFAVATVPVTNALYALFDPRHDLPRAADDHPAADVTWYDAALCAAWFGCRLPTEAQWEYACGAGSPHEWCCTEADLPRYGWYSENASGTVHPVAARDPNALGLHDFHGQVWEWCRDDYDLAFYTRAPRWDPVNSTRPAGWHIPQRHKVVRGGSFLSLPEMCRTRFRFHEPAGFWAYDLGFRMVRNTLPSARKDTHA
jgi:formylglycine-generating enzyme required for sulfatase activity